MLTLRLARVGKKKQAFYKLIVSEKTRDTYGTYLEALGNLNPHTNPSTLTVNKERIDYWLKQGATMSATVNNLLIENKIITGDKVKAWKPKKKAAEAKPVEAPKTEAKAETPKANEETKAEAKSADEVKKDEPKTETKPAESAKQEKSEEKTNS